MELNIYNALILAGIVQGLIFTVIVFFTKKYRARSIYYLCTLILVYSLSNLQYFLSDSGILTMVQMYQYVFIPFAALTPVLIYFYVLTFLHPTTKISIRKKALYLPFIIFSLLTLVYKWGALTNYENNSFYAFFDFVLNFQEIFSVLLTVAILIAVLVEIKHYEKQNQHFKAQKISMRLKWLKITLLLMMVLTIIWAILVYKNIFVKDTFTSFYVLWIGLAALIYWLGHIGIYKYGIIEERKNIRAFSIKNKSPKLKKSTKNEHIIALEGLLVNDKIYLDSNLTLESIAHKLQLSTSYLSRILNAELQTNFTEYLNSFRIKEAKSYLKNPEFSKYTIIAIGLEAGFNSKSTFFNVFKKTTGQTPLEFKKEHFNS